MKKVFIYLVIFDSVFACNSISKEEPGKDCGKDNIHFSTQMLSFKSTGGRDSITAKGGYTFYSLQCDNSNPILIPNNIVNKDTILFSTDNSFFEEYAMVGTLSQTITIVGEWYKITRKTGNILIFEIKPNTLGVLRKFEIGVTGGGCFGTSILVTQSAE